MQQDEQIKIEDSCISRFKNSNFSNNIYLALLITSLALNKCYICKIKTKTKQKNK